MKWFVYRVVIEAFTKTYYVNARTENAAKKRLAAFMSRFNHVGEPQKLGDKPQETLVHCWHHYGEIATVVYKDD